MLDRETAREQVLKAAEALFYAQGIQAVGMDAVRGTSGVSLKRLYQLFPSKEALVLQFLERRDTSWRQALARYVDTHATPDEQVLAVYDWLHQWFSEPDYRGCAFINSFGELGGISTDVADQARHHKQAFRDYLAGLVEATGLPQELADQLNLLAEGAITTSAITGTPEPAHQAREAARLLMQAHRQAEKVDTQDAQDTHLTR
ncbi:TetR/AcrR family transcriptional regulator [Streptomyces phaeoluteigriseus]|uniref:TetR/AcrR family transcriptional regulator n=1 Tax=Streptomyces phaeoluteigriseus TaxID=114686 RepID=A0ABY4Z9C5_9ACTN|nr:TetR/AcrR family transcriptional regulator [Streptomyces phaeoluteigriseus]USQ85399.1 TetR/AcrR family transcriptional regulator [Streptomyces phaeoluteigriseus]